MAVQAVGTQGRDTLSVGMEQDPRIGGRQPAEEESPSRAPKPDDWNQEEAYKDWKRMGLPGDWERRLLEERSLRKATWMLRNWLLDWASKKLEGKETVKLRLRRETFENSAILNRVGERPFLLELLVIVQVLTLMSLKILWL